MHELTGNHRDQMNLKKKKSQMGILPAVTIIPFESQHEIPVHL